MSGTYYDWSPLFDAINNNVNRYSDQNRYQAMIDQMMGKQVMTPGSVGMPQLAAVPSQLNATAPQIPGAPAPRPMTANMNLGGQAATPGTPGGMSYDGPAGQALGASANTLLPMLRNAPPSMGFPLLLQSVMKNADRQQKIADATLTPMSNEEKVSLGYKPDAVVYKDISGNPVVKQDSDMLSQGAVGQKLGLLRQQGSIAAQNPLTKEQLLEHNDRQAAMNKPIAMSYGSTLVNPRTGQVIGGGMPGSGGSPHTGDPAAPNITGQTGLSMNGFNYLIGNTSALPRDAMTRRQASAEADAYAARSGTDISSLQSQYKAYNNVLQTNLQKSNTMEILNKEVQGTVANLAPVADRIGGGDLKWTKEGVQFLGRLSNDPNSQQYAFYLNQLRADLAGFNAVSGGKMDQHGNAHADDSDFRAAEQVIQNGLNSGGARGLAAAVQATGTKNRAIVDTALDDANKGIWTLFGVGQNYKPRHAPAAGGGGGGANQPPNVPSGWTLHQDAKGNKAYVSPDGKQFIEAH